MRRENKKRNKIIIGLTSLLLIMTVGYAAFQTNLNIKGTSKISSNWDIRITNVTSGNKTGNAENAKTPTWTNLTASMEANLYEKGDAMEYEVTVENKGTFDAKLENILTNIKSSNEAIKISFSGYTKGEKLYKNTSKTVNVKIEYNKDFTGTPLTNSSEVEITLDYGQAEGGTIEPTNGYLVTYDCKTNGGEDCSKYNEYLSEGSKIDLSYTSTKAGWTFAGWNTNKDATTGLTTLEMNNADVTLYAIFKKTINVSYTKGTGISNIGKTTDSCVMYNKATSCQITLPSITALTGYGVDGWYNSSNTKVGTEGTKVNVSSNITYTAKGKANSYTLTYNYNGATGGNSTTSKAVTYGGTYGTLPTPTRSYVVTYNYNSATGGNTTTNATSNYTFNGWYKESSFTNQVTSSTIYNTVGNSTIYAKWTGISIVLPTPTKTGYTFSGWYSDSSFTNKVGDGGASYTPTSSLTLYAKWTINSYNVTYNYSQNGGTTSTKTTATVNYGSSIDLSPTATKAGWTFVGWNTNKDATSGLSSLNMSTSNVTLYAIYRKEAVTLAAKFNGNGATLSSTNNLTCTLPAVYNNASQQASCNVSAPSITRSGYNIIGYNTATGSTTNNSSYNTSTKALTLTSSNNNSTWYAITSKTITITFNKNGASTQTNASGTAVSDTTVTRTCSMYNTSTTCNVTSPTIVGASGFSVVGYNTATGSTTSAWNHNTAKAVSANATYYAVTSKAAKTITISFNANGASAIGSTSQSCTIPAVYNGASQATSCNITSPSITASSNTPTVVGWSTASATHSNQWSVNTAKAVSANATYYAQTTKAAKTITITFNKNGASTQTNGSGTAVSDTTVTRACTIAATYNGTAQATTCNVTSPTIVGASGFSVVGYNTASSSTTSAWNHNTAKAVSANATYYAVTKSTSAYTATFNANGATSVGSSSLSCYRYNGVSSCNVTAPSITRSGFTITGWNTTASATTSSLNVGATLTLTSNPTYYAITKKVVTLTYAKDSTVSAVGATSGTCTIQNTATACAVTLPTITPLTGYTTLGWYNGTTKVGNASSSVNVSSNITYTAKASDVTKPTISLSPNTQTTYVSGGKAVTVNLADSGSGLKASQPIYYAWSTSNATVPTSWSSVTSTNTAGAKSATVAVPATSSASLTGTYYLWIKAGTLADVSGNTSNQVVSALFKFDNVIPTCSWSSGPTGTTVNGYIKSGSTLTYVLKCTDVNGFSDSTIVASDIESSNTGVATISAVSSSTAITNGYQWTVTAKAGSTTGNAQFRLKAGAVSDAAANKNAVSSYSTALKTDNTAPTITASNSSGSSWVKYGTGVKISGSYSDSLSGINSGTIYYSYDKSTQYNDWDSATASAYSGTWSAARNNQVWVRAADKLGNYSAWKDAGYIRILSAFKSSTSTGNTAGPGPSYFHVVYQVREVDKNSTQARLQWRCYISVTSGDFYGSTGSTNWNGGFTLHGPGTYNDSGWVDYASSWVNYGSTKSDNCNAYYNGSSGTHSSTAYVNFTPCQTC